jgi:DNA-binding NtrC family response regulator
MGINVLVVDDEASSRTGLVSLVTGWGYDVEAAGDGEAGLAKAVATPPMVVVSDLVMPKLDGLGLLRALQSELPFVSVILLSGQGTIEDAVAAMKEGAYDFLTKPVDTARLKVLIAKTAEKTEALREVALLRRRVKDMWGVGKIVGTSAPMQEVYRLVELAAPTPAPVLITGESGTGKELVSRTIHDRSTRADGPFVAINCAAIPETLLESEVFGHEKGAFTGALERRAGCFELAHKGTLFLDEIGEMNPGMQAKFLRILQDGVVRRLGGKTEFSVDVRVVAATNKDPLEGIASGTLREDLYYRLNVVSLRLPPLRERREDIPLLVQAFLEEFNAKYDRRIKSVDEPTLQTLTDHAWPGNVRELRNTLERAVIVCDGDLVAIRHLPPISVPKDTHPAADSVPISLGTTIREAEQRLILRTLESTANNKTRAAEILGISLKTLHNKLRLYRA